MSDKVTLLRLNPDKCFGAVCLAVKGGAEFFQDDEALAESLGIEESDVPELLEHSARADCAYASVSLNYDWGAWLAADPESGEGWLEVYNYADLNAGPEVSRPVSGVTTRAAAKLALITALRERCDGYARSAGVPIAPRKSFKITYIKGMFERK